METKEIAILVASLALAVFSLYRKHKLRNAGNQPVQKVKNELLARDKDNDYEPYSGK
jgi:hypothetical protein